MSNDSGCKAQGTFADAGKQSSTVWEVTPDPVVSRDAMSSDNLPLEERTSGVYHTKEEKKTTLPQHEASDDDIAQLAHNLKEFAISKYGRSVSHQQKEARKNHNKRGYRMRQQRRKKKPQSREDGPGLLQDIHSMVSNLSEYETTQIVPWISLIESLGLLFHQLAHATTFMDVLVDITQCVKAVCKGKSVVSMISDFMSMFGQEDRVAIMRPHSSEDPFYLTRFSEKFSKLKNNRNWTNLQIAISGLASMLVADFKGIEWSLNGFKVVAIHPWKSNASCADFFEAIIKTIDYFWTTGYRCIMEKSLDPLLFEDQSIQEFETKYTKVLGDRTLAMNGNLSDMTQYRTEVQELITTCARMKNLAYDGWIGKDLSAKYIELCKIDEFLEMQARSCKQRITPYAVSLYGPTSVGKSVMTMLVAKIVLSAMGFEFDPDRVTVLDLKQNFEDTAKSNSLFGIMDEIANNKNLPGSKNHTIALKRLINTVATTAEMSHVDQKGRIHINWKGCCITTNKKDLDAPSFSNCPESILRLFQHVTMEVMPEYRKPGTMMLNGDHPNLIGRDPGDFPDDVWDLTIEEVANFRESNGTIGWRFVPLWSPTKDGNMIRCTNLRLSTFLEVLSIQAALWRRREEKNLHRTKEMNNLELCKCGNLPCFCVCHKIKFCGKCERAQYCCICDYEPQSVTMRAAYVCEQSFYSYLRSLNPFPWLTARLVTSYATAYLIGELDRMAQEVYTPAILSIIPDSLLRTRFVQSWVNWLYCRKVHVDARASFWALYAVLYSTYLFALCFNHYALPFIVICHLWLNFKFNQHKIALMQQISEELARRRNSLSEGLRAFRDHRYAVPATIAGFGVFILMLKAICKSPHLKPNADALSPEGVEKTKGWFDSWFSSPKLDVSVSSNCRAASHDQLVTSLGKNLWLGKFSSSGDVCQSTNVICVRKGIILFPRHVFHPSANLSKPSYPYVVFEGFRNSSPGGIVSRVIIERSTCYEFSTDCLAAFIPNCPDVKDITKWFPESLPRGTADASLLVRMSEANTLASDDVFLTFRQTGHAHMSFYGCDYKTCLARVGSCMGVLISKTKDTCVLGFHLGGDGNKACGGIITKQDLKLAYSKLDERFCLLASATDIPEEQYDTKVLSSDKAHPKSVVHQYDAKASFEVIGSTKVRAKATSSVEPSILAPHAKAIFGVNYDFGPPAMDPNWVPFNDSLEHVAYPEHCYPPSLLRRACEDWMDPLYSAIKDHCQREPFRPLTLHEAVNGLPGKRFMDPLVMSTSMGFPLMGPKEEHFDMEVKDNFLVRTPKEHVIKEMDRLMTCWKQGVRGYPVFRSVLKDEPTQVGKTKVRVFQCGPVAFSILLRTYFLPIVRFLALYPVLSECAVGINSFSPQWQELMDYAEKYGTERTIAWDYSKYDLKMSSQVTREALYALIRLCKYAGYPEEAIYIMKMMVNDLVHPLIDWNGTMLLLTSLNTSGNNITVQINSIANSFYCRMCFFATYPQYEYFRDCVAITTYGDDVYGTVESKFPKFNFFSFRDWIGKYGKKVTPPDKDSEGSEYMPGSDFLKRKSNYIPELDIKIGMIDEKSLIKPMLANVRSKAVTEVEVARSVLESAAHEIFAHGREKYDEWMLKLRDVAERANVVCPILDITFDERVEAWKEKYCSPQEPTC